MYHDCNTNNDNGDKNSAFPMTATPFWDRTKAKKKSISWLYVPPYRHQYPIHIPLIPTNIDSCSLISTNIH